MQTFMFCWKGNFLISQKEGDTGEKWGKRVFDISTFKQTNDRTSQLLTLITTNDLQVYQSWIYFLVQLSPNQSELMVFNFADSCATKGRQIISLFYLCSFPHEFSFEVLSLFLQQQRFVAVREELHEEAWFIDAGAGAEKQQPKVGVGANWLVVILARLSALVRSALIWGESWGRDTSHNGMTLISCGLEQCFWILHIICGSQRICLH